MSDQDFLDQNHVGDGPAAVIAAVPAAGPFVRVVETTTTAPNPGGRVLEVPPPSHVKDLGQVLRFMIADGGFQPRAKEVASIRNYFEDLAKIEQAILETSEDRIRKEFKAELLERDSPPQAPVEGRVEAARQHRRALKERRRTLTAGIASTVSPMLQRALQAATICLDLAEESEKSRAESFGVPFVESETLRALHAARRTLVEHSKSSERSPDLIAVRDVCNLLGITLE